jgi:hypothetical protein
MVCATDIRKFLFNRVSTFPPFTDQIFEGSMIAA